MRKLILILAVSFSFSILNCTAQKPSVDLKITNPVLPGDFPDPSVVKIGDEYWATATSSEWAPLFPLLRSTDLVHWELKGHVFPDKSPDWSEANYWAPEITYENGKIYIYYVAKKKGGNLCLGIASADNPLGPYKDHGPLVCQEVGSIDAFPVRDENGALYIIWKEDGNSQKKPTPIWAQQINEERTALVGERIELFRNEKDWEGNLVEGPALIKKGDYFYTFFAANGCCGKGCTYAEGVARSKSIKGPWEKYSKNPILINNAKWKCPGHGSTVIGNNGKYYFLYHAYSTDNTVYVGRQGILDEFTWTADGWPVFSSSAPGINTSYNLSELNFSDEFTKEPLDISWQWPVPSHGHVNYSVVSAGKGMLKLNSHPETIGTALAQRTKTGDYIATTAIDLSSLQVGVKAGIAAIGSPDDAIGVSVENGKIIFWQVKAGKEEILNEVALSKSSQIQLRLTAKNGSQFQSSWSLDGKKWNEAAPVADGSYLPPWDRGVRAGLISKGPVGAFAQFDWFKLINTKK